jgi:hypothetical protein
MGEDTVITADIVTTATFGHWSSAEDAENAFLEDVFGDEALAFARHQNAATVSALGEPTQSEYYGKVLAILESKDKVIFVKNGRRVLWGMVVSSISNVFFCCLHGNTV